MISSRSIDDLHPTVRKMALAHTAACVNAGIDLLIYCTLRDNAMQDVLYAQGRTTKGKIVTNARAGESWHNYGMAYDCVPLRGGKPVWDTSDPIWAKVGTLGEAAGLEWAGRWRKFREFPHFQYTGGLTISDAREGGRFA